MNLHGGFSPPLFFFYIYNVIFCLNCRWHLAICESI
nr:MAG TPA: hypothetical protein [Caudoviricetes sp.]